MAKAKATNDEVETVQMYDEKTGEVKTVTMDEYQKIIEGTDVDETPEEQPAPDFKQKKADVAKMVDFYKANYPAVWVVTCLENDHVIGVEVEGQFTDGVPLEKGRTFYNFDGLCLSVRRREDTTDDGRPMYGYECVCGNRTTIAAVEKDIVPERTVLVDGQQVVADSGAVSMGTPYEMAQMKAKIATQQQAGGKKADYENNGNVERYETFKIERVK